MVLVIAVSSKWTMRQLDVMNAFLHSFLKGTVYMEQPPRFQNVEKSYHVGLGLIIFPNFFFILILFIAKEIHLFLFFRSKTLIILMLVHIDDAVVIRNNGVFIEGLIHKLKKRFALKDFGNLHCFLSLEIKYFFGGIFLAQTKYMKDLLCRARMLHCSHFATSTTIKHPSTLKDNTTEY